MIKYLINIDGEKETQKLGYEIGKLLFPGSVVSLTGDLGVGKTTFTKSIAKALNIKQVVNSPTFTIIKEYEGDLNLYHMDVYRISDKEDLGFDEYFFNDGITVIEWAENIKSLLPYERLNIVLKKISENKRIIEINPLGNKYEYLCEVLKNEKIID